MTSVRRLRCAAPRDGIRCVVFDLDGTFYTRALYHADSVTFARQAITDLVGLGPHEASQLLRRRRIVGRGRDRGSVTALLESLGVERSAWTAYLDARASTSGPLPANAPLVEAVRTLDASVPTALLTNTTGSRCDEVLRAVGFTGDDFSITVSADAGLSPKPGQAAFREVARRAGCRTSAMFGIGDRWSVDVQPIVEMGGGGIEIETPDDVARVCHALRRQVLQPTNAPLCWQLRRAVGSG